MPRYIIRAANPRQWIADEDVWGGQPSHVPSVCDHEATDTGLLDAAGNPIMRAPNPCGFGRDDEW